MILVHGTKRIAKKLGQVADFCPLCRDLQPCELIRIGRASHIYFISFGQGSLVGHISRCKTCDGEFDADPLQFASTEKRVGVDLDTLAHTTLPNWQEVYGQRLSIEAQVRTSPRSLPPKVRWNLLVEPLRLFNPSVEQRYERSTHMDKQSGAGCMGTLLTFAVLLGITASAPPRYQDGLLLTALAIFAIGTIYTFVQLGFGPKRFLHTKVVPALARTLAPLQPTREELAEVLARSKQVGMRIGEKLTVETLARHMGI